MICLIHEKKWASSSSSQILYNDAAETNQIPVFFKAETNKSESYAPCILWCKIKYSKIYSSYLHTIILQRPKHKVQMIRYCSWLHWITIIILKICKRDIFFIYVYTIIINSNYFQRRRKPILVLAAFHYHFKFLPA